MKHISRILTGHHWLRRRQARLTQLCRLELRSQTGVLQRLQHLVLGIFGTLLMLPCAFGASFSVDGFAVEKIASGLSLPTSIAFHPDGRIFVAQKNGLVRVVENNNLLDASFVALDDVNTWGDRGLIGIAIDPDVQTNGYVYLAYTYENDASNRGGAKTARVVRFTANGSAAIEGSAQVILGSTGGSPASPSCTDFPIDADCIASDSITHTVGALRFGPDGKLYVAIGDGAGFDGVDQKAFRAQDLETLSGKILRIETDGRAVTDNPFYTGNANDNRSKVWANGFRNPYRFNFHPDGGRLLGGDVGWSNREEINHVVPGGNYGWPCREGTLPTTGYAGLPACDIDYDLTEPVYDYAHVNNSGAVTGGAVATSSTYPSWFRGRYVFADFAFGTLRYLTLDAQSQVLNVADLASDIAGPVEIVTGPDGLVYYLSISRGELLRLVFTGDSGSQPPLAAADYTTSNTNPLTVSFTSAGSAEPNGSSLQYLWDFGDGNFSSDPNPQHTYALSGTYAVTLTVTSLSGLTASTILNVLAEPSNIADSQPFIVSLTSDSNPKYVGSAIAFSAEMGNTSAGAAFAVRFEVLNSNNDIVDDIRIQPVEIPFGQTTQRAFSWFPESPGFYTLRVSFLRADSNRLIQPVNNDALTFEVVPRSSAENTGSGVFSSGYLIAVLLLVCGCTRSGSMRQRRR
jgi:glucose/arabinose dehydrogenase